jgi:flagellar hook-basal body complex protein FliE
MSGMELGNLPLQPFGRARLLGDAVQVPGDGDKRAEGGFADALHGALARVTQLQDDVRQKSEAIMTGQPVELHELMTSIGKSEVAFNLMLEVRNKLVDAWDKVSRAVV